MLGSCSLICFVFCRVQFRQDTLKYHLVITQLMWRRNGAVCMSPYWRESGSSGQSLRGMVKVKVNHMPCCQSNLKSQNYKINNIYLVTRRLTHLHVMKSVSNKAWFSGTEVNIRVNRGKWHHYSCLTAIWSYDGWNNYFFESQA